MKTMNGCERIETVLGGGVADVAPTMLHSFMAAAGEAGVSMKEYRERPEVMAKCLVDFAEKYGLDGILTDMDTAIEASALGVVVDYPVEEPARVIGAAGGSAEEIAARVEVPRLLGSERVQGYLEALRLIKKAVGGRIFLRGNADQGAFSLAMLLYGMENFFMDLLDEEKAPGLVVLMERCYEVHLAFHKAVFAAGADMTSFGDSSCGPDLMSREMYRKFAWPFHRRLKEDLAKEGIRTVCHICGNLDAIAVDVAELGFAGVEMDYKTNVRKAREVFAGRSVMFGPIDPSGVFYFGNAKLVEEKTREVLEIFEGKGLVIGAGCALPRGVPEENLRSFVRTVKEWKG